MAIQFINDLSVTGNATFSTTGVTDNIVLTSTDTSASSAPDLVLYRNAAVADSDTLGVVEYKGKNGMVPGSGTPLTYNAIYSRIADASNNQSILTLSANKGNGSGSFVHSVNISAIGTSNSATGAILINPTTDFSLPAYNLDVNGDAYISSDVLINGDLSLDNIANATSDTDQFVVSDNGVIKYRTGAEVRSDIGAGTGTVSGTGTTSNLTLWSDGPNGVLSDAPIKLGTGTDSLIMNALSLSLASGDYSIAMGQQSEASGDNSVAMGLNGTASGAYSLTAGNNTTASGSNSVAMGQGTLASSSISTAFGNGTTASGLTSTAMGSGTTASGHRSTATGRSTTASGEVSFSMGYGSIASGDGSFAGAGVQTSSDDGGEATGKNSFAFGYLAKAIADGAIAIGSQCEANATNCVTLGNNATSSGINSFAAGLGVTVSGQTSTAFGSNTTASGSFSFACGDNTTASGNNSFAAGKANTASGTGSIVMGGTGTGASTAAGEASAVLGGELNIANGVNSTILGGQKNTINVNSQDSSILGGEDNEMAAGSTNSVILGGIGLLGGGTHQTICGVANVSKNNCKLIVGVGTYTSPTNVSRENGLEVRDSGQLVLGKYTGTNFNPVATNSNDLLSVNAVGDVQQSRTLPRGIKVGPDTISGTIAANAGAIRYREDGNNSYVDMIMKTSAFNYAWVNIVQNNWT